MDWNSNNLYLLSGIIYIAIWWYGSYAFPIIVVVLQCTISENALYTYTQDLSYSNSLGYLWKCRYYCGQVTPFTTFATVRKIGYDKMRCSCIPRDLDNILGAATISLTGDPTLYVFCDNEYYNPLVTTLNAYPGISNFLKVSSMLMWYNWHLIPL